MRNERSEFKNFGLDTQQAKSANSTECLLGAAQGMLSSFGVLAQSSRNTVGNGA